ETTEVMVEGTGRPRHIKVTVAATPSATRMSETISSLVEVILSTRLRRSLHVVNDEPRVEARDGVPTSSAVHLQPHLIKGVHVVAEVPCAAAHRHDRGYRSVRCIHREVGAGH